MSEQQRAELVAAAVALHATLESFLMQITKEVQGQPAPSASPATPPASAAPCQHPNKEDQRTFGVTEAWRCKDCGFEFRR